MKNTFRNVLLSLTMAVVLPLTITAQNQNNPGAIGLRLGGYASGFSLKQHIENDIYLEGILGIGPGSFLITGLYEQHKFLEDAPGLQWFYGAGFHFCLFRKSGGYYFTFTGSRLHYERFSVIGLDMILGLDYKLKNIPVNIGLDTKPMVDFMDGAVLYFDTGISVRYTF